MLERKAMIYNTLNVERADYKTQSFVMVENGWRQHFGDNERRRKYRIMNAGL